MPSLSSQLRSMLERAIIKARDVAEEAALSALNILAVKQTEPFTSLNTDQRRLRNALRAKARQLGNGNLDKGFQPLIEGVAYEQWHRRLFARFLAENNLLMHPNGVAITLEECNELAVEEGEADGWQLAAHYASAMLPGIFRADDPAVQVQFSPEGRHKIERIIIDLPSIIFTSDDTLGWVYQFWQTKKKKEVNVSGRKIGGEDIAPVTQLFTEDYMVKFLLENSLGAWWAARYPSSPLLKQFFYLKLKDDGTPATGTFPGWPKSTAKVTIMDPCCGSGHFLVVAFDMLLQMRIEEEGLSERQASDAVLRDNLFGLEIDPRCTQIAAFELAFAAWKAGGYRQLPIPNIACSGIAVTGQLETWIKLAGDDVNLRLTLERHYLLFRNAPDLGSLINPNDVSLQDRMFSSDYAQVEPFLKQVLTKERTNGDPASAIFGAVAEGVTRAAKLLADTYTLVATNVPYLARSKHAETLKKFCDIHYNEAKSDLATVFIERNRAFTANGGSYAIVTPQNWLFLGSYEILRKRLLKEQSWQSVAKLGEGGFESSAAAGAFTVLLILTNCSPSNGHKMANIDASSPKIAKDKNILIRQAHLEFVEQLTQLRNPDARIAMRESLQGMLLEKYAEPLQGISPADLSRFGRQFWEVKLNNEWHFWQGSPDKTTEYGGRSKVIRWNSDLTNAVVAGKAYIRGHGGWGKLGVAVGQMRQLPCTLYTGEKADTNVAVIIPKDPAHLPAIWAFSQSPEYNNAVRQIDQSLKVTNSSLVKVPFDLKYWQAVADSRKALPKPYSNDPTQWLFGGCPVDSTEALQVAVARLLGYQWPQQNSDEIDAHTVKDGIICLASMAEGEGATELLRKLLAQAYGEVWSPTQQDRLLTEVGFAGKSLDFWLRNGFFSQHCSLFHNRPFIWHIWDGLKDGFSILVNYHRLDPANLDRLIYTYLGSWITTQRAERDAKVSGAELRLVAALKLQEKLEAIRDGEKPYDIFVRWKPLHEQPMGWNPDLNDGVRVNIRPFVTAGILRERFTINWNKDRGINPNGSERLNDLHYTLAQKRDAREKALQ